MLSARSGRSDRSGTKSTWTQQPLGGGKTISYFAGVVLLINNITGPGVPSLPNMFAEAGWLFPAILFAVVCIMSSLSTAMFCEAMHRVPGNEYFSGRIEYTTVIRHYFGDRMYWAANVGLCGALQSLNIVSVIQSAQVMDNAISAVFGSSCGINISPFANQAIDGSGTLEGSTKGWSCIDTNSIDNGNAWGCHIIVSVGFLIAMGLAIPAGWFNLDDNMYIQVGAFILTIMCWLIWIIACFFSDEFKHGGDITIPAVTDSSKPWSSQAGVVGTILFNFGFVTTVPSWVNEKKPQVSVNKTVWVATWLCNVVFFVIGIPGAMAFQRYLSGPATATCRGANDAGDITGCAGDLMAVFTGIWMPKDIQSHSAWNFIVKLSVYLFPVVAVISSIPVFSIVIKYNCIENGWRESTAFLWGVVFPWVVAIPLLYQPDALLQFINYSSLIFVSFTDFIVPWCLYIVLLREDYTPAVPVKPQDTVQIPSPQPQDTVQNYDPEADKRAGLVEKENAGLLEKEATGDHYAIPPEWGLSSAAKKRTAVALVLVMIGLCLYGIITSIQQGATNDWDCAAVGGS